MKKFDVQMALDGVREARRKWGIARREYESNMDFVMSRLVREAAVNLMSADEVADRVGMSARQVRIYMREAGLDPRRGKRLLAKTAAEALAENSALMGIEPHEMDLTSPLAYLPMGEELKQQLIDARVKRVTEFPETDLTAEEFEAVETAAFMYGTTNSDLITLINTLLADRAQR